MEVSRGGWSWREVADESLEVKEKGMWRYRERYMQVSTSCPHNE